MHVDDLLVAMRAGVEQPPERIEAFVRGVVDGSVSRPQAAAWLAWAFQRGLTDAETVALTRSMTASGHVMRWPEGPTLIDKHSTGGVGDKVSLVLGPLWAELGLRVPMVSGRGLGHTGGTLDKLEAIPGYRTDLDDAELGSVLAAVGCFISGQTASVAPADRVLYALRNETCTVESIPLIVGSILSKKLAEGVERLVLDVKTGSGAFMKTLEASRALADALVRVARGSGVSCVAHITAMERPLGRAVGNAVEVREAADCLRGGGPEDLRALTVALAEHPRAAEVLASGRAYPRFLSMIEAQGGDPRAVDGGVLSGERGVSEVVVTADRSGVVQQVDAGGVGRAAFVLGAGRRRAEDPVDFGVGCLVHAKPGDAVRPGDPLVTLIHRDGCALEEARAMVASAVVIADGAPSVPPLLAAFVG
jgi:pyrimidine-nucleoside phosphorylase